MTDLLSNPRNFWQGALLALYLVLFIPFWKAMVLGVLFACACAPALRRLRVVLKTRRRDRKSVV